MGIENELSGIHRELSMFPERAFHFKNAGTIIIEQDVADVGSIVWDAEILLAHYLDQAYGSRLAGMRILELGAGTGLAGIVAARLGASVVLTDQSKLLPTLVRSARANALDLEYRSRPTSQKFCLGSRSPADATRSSQNASERCSDAVDTAPGAAGSETTAPPARSSTFSGGNDAACLHLTRRESGGGRATGSRNSSAKGSWRVAELLFSESEEEILRWRGNLAREETVGGGNEGGRDEDLYDLVIAADIVYLNHLWDAIAFTLKVLLKPNGTILMSFEQRRRNVDGFFGPPRFGGEVSGRWKHGEELDLRSGDVAGQELAEAAQASRVRIFRMREWGSVR